MALRTKEWSRSRTDKINATKGENQQNQYETRKVLSGKDTHERVHAFA